MVHIGQESVQRGRSCLLLSVEVMKGNRRHAWGQLSQCHEGGEGGELEQGAHFRRDRVAGNNNNTLVDTRASDLLQTLQQGRLA